MKSHVLGAVALCAATRAMGRPPYITDDPAPTDNGDWEIYAFTAGEGEHSDVDETSYLSQCIQPASRR